MPISRLLLLTLLALSPAYSLEKEIAQKIDTYIDSRFEAREGATETLFKELRSGGIKSMEELEAAIRAPRASYPEKKPIGTRPVTCYHVDYSSKYYLHIPPGHDATKPSPLIVVGHGGNSSMPEAYAMSTAASYMRAYRPLAGKMNAIMVVPASCRGWGHIGKSLILSTISDIQRHYPIDPDRIYLTGQSMGGHAAYRAALSLPDRWGAISPHSGGYNFVEKKSIPNLHNVPGYAVWGKTEPYGINTDNRINEKWAKENKLDWIFVEKNGGHTIYIDELPKIADFFQKNPRNLYRKKVVMRQGGSMKFIKPWGIKGWPEHQVAHETRPLRWNLRHWVEVEPRPGSKETLELIAENLGKNQIKITSSKVRKLSLYFHPKMVNFGQPVTITINGKKAFSQKLKKDPYLTLDLVREFDDRGRIFWAKVTLNIDNDQDVPLGN